jgi:hypothetical protein
MDPSVVTSASESLIKQGILGTVVVLLLIACAVLWKAYAAANEARIKSEDENRDKYTALLERVMDALNDNNTILHIVRDRMGNRKS